MRACGHPVCACGHVCACAHAVLLVNHNPRPAQLSHDKDRAVAVARAEPRHEMAHALKLNLNSLEVLSLKAAKVAQFRFACLCLTVEVGHKSRPA